MFDAESPRLREYVTRPRNIASSRGYTSIRTRRRRSGERARAMSLILSGMLLAALGQSLPANARSHDGHGYRVPAHMHFDSRFAHNHYYHDHGYAVRGIPRGAYLIHHRGHVFLYHGGEWYRRHGGVSVVIGAPIGALVPVLPPFYSTVWWRGVPYYYADDTYYVWDAGASEYQVVSPPANIETDGTTQAPPSDSIFVYPKNGQSPEQQSRDRYECHRSAVQATGYDPTEPGGGVPADTASSKRADYMRAQAACLDARGYSVR